LPTAVYSGDTEQPLLCFLENLALFSETKPNLAAAEGKVFCLKPYDL